MANKVIDVDTRMYWQVMQNINAGKAIGQIDPDDIDELEVLAAYTANPVVARMANKAILANRAWVLANSQACGG
ncbi:MAG: hypothetical protein WC829_01910 [Hyphomicrobium sp.]|jgi:hypothetical protein